MSIHDSRSAILGRWRASSATLTADMAPALAEDVSRALDWGEPLLALDMARRGRALPGLEPAVGNRLAQLEALALARSGAPGAAHRALQSLVDSQIEESAAVDSESLGILARTYKDLAECAPQAERRRCLERARACYEQAHFISRRPWTGVNVANLRLALGDEQGAQDMASEVLASMHSGSAEDDEWSQLTKAECHLICRNPAGAAKFYAVARARGVPEGRMASARRNAALVARTLGMPEEQFEDLFPRPHLVVFTGHRIDAAGRQPPRFDPASEVLVRSAIRAHLSALEARVGVCPAADGGDILFAEAMLERRGDLHVVLPSEPAAFKSTSVAPSWHARFDAVLAGAASVTVLSRDANEAVDYEYANRTLMGIARLRADRYAARLTGLAVWDGQAGLQGGAGHAVGLWSRSGVDTLAIHPATGQVTVVPAGREVAVPQLAPEHRLVSILFADAVGYSKLSASEIAAFSTEVLQPLGAELDRLGDQVLCRNTWGDALYVAFAAPAQAARFASRVASVCRAPPREGSALPPGLGFRVSLHAGPAREVWDPVSKSRNFIGTHVNWGARIEPVAPMGGVYTSEAFAALCALEPDAKGLEFAYAGTVPLAKGFGAMPLYALSVPSA